MRFWLSMVWPFKECLMQRRFQCSKISELAKFCCMWPAEMLQSEGKIILRALEKLTQRIFDSFTLTQCGFLPLLCQFYQNYFPEQKSHFVWFCFHLFQAKGRIIFVNVASSFRISPSILGTFCKKNCFPF